MSGWQRIRSSFESSAGDVVFGMEDGTVSILGLVFGVAATTTDTSVVVIAGATGAISAAVSMMAGTYLDVESARDAAELRREALASHPAPVADSTAHIARRLSSAGLAPAVADKVVAAADGDQEVLARLSASLDEPASDEGRSPIAHASWMFVSDLLAASVPVVPFALLSMGTARIVSLVLTTVLLIALGVFRSRVGGKPVGRTVAETLGIAAAAAVAGIGIGWLVDQLTTPTGAG